LVNPACTLSWLAIAPSTMVMMMLMISSERRWLNSQRATLPIQSWRNSCFGDLGRRGRRRGVWWVRST